MHIINIMLQLQLLTESVLSTLCEVSGTAHQHHRYSTHNAFLNHIVWDSVPSQGPVPEATSCLTPKVTSCL